MEFPHLSDTRFPDLQSVNVYAYRNDFDYTRWTVNTRVTLTNVLWNGDYRDVVKFPTNDERDSWFDSYEGAYRVKLLENHQMPPEGGIKLPIPFAVAVRYNYLYIDIPEKMPGSDPSIAYESDEGVRRWYFFVNDVEYRSPNATMFTLSLDVWTQFQNDIDIKYLFLERGHAPIAASDVDAYLSNPIDNSSYLLAPDVTPAGATVSRASTFIPFGNGKKYVCIASTCAPDQIVGLGVTTLSDDYEYGPITYSDTAARYGYQLQVNGFGAGNDYDWSALKSPSSPVNPNGVIANNTFCYAVDATEVYGDGATFMQDVLATSPSFMNTVLGCFVVDESMVDLGTSVLIAGHVMHEVKGTSLGSDFALPSKADFAYPAEYQRFAKLYTYPYASLELTDNEGKSVTVRIENVSGSARVAQVSELAFPYVKMRTFFTGINGVGSDTYTWVSLDGSAHVMDMPNSDWFDTCFDMEIPCFALYMDGETAWYLDNFNDAVRGGRESALVAYHNAVRPANTQRANVVDSDATMYANTDRDATTLTTNTNNTENTSRANMDKTIATNNLKTSRADVTSTAMLIHQNYLSSQKTSAANTATSTTATAENETTAAAAMNTAMPQMGAEATIGIGATIAYSAAVGSAAGPAGTLAGALGGMAIGAAAGAINTAANFAGASANASMAVQANSVAANAVIASNSSQTAATNSYNTSATELTNAERDAQNSYNNDMLDENTTRNNNNNRTNAGNTAATMRNNARATQSTNDSNAGHTREVSVLNAKETLENARNRLQYRLDDAALRPARPIGGYSGDPTADYMRTRGVQVKVRRMADGDVRMVGDFFARYGYALNQMWNVTDLCPMRHFCYWKASDAWIDDRKSSNNVAVSIIQAMFDRGVTVWNNPSEVGRVDIYDN